MKPLGKSLIWASTTLVMMLGVAAPPNLQAQEGESFECSNETLKGAYGLVGTSTSKVSFAGEGDFHAAIAGGFVADGRGEITASTFTSIDDGSPDPESLGGFEVGGFDLSQLPGFRWEYTVNPDCTGTTRILAPDGVTEVVSTAFVLVNGGREGWFVDTTGPFVQRGTFKRIDPVDERHDQKVDALADDLALTKELVRRMAAVLGVLRRNE